jgi:hypothetical protein
MLVDQNIVALDPELAWLKLLRLEGVGLHPCSQRVRASQRRLIPRREELNLGMGPLYRDVEVAAIEGVIGTAQALDHLLLSVGHPPRSIPTQETPGCAFHT